MDEKPKKETLGHAIQRGMNDIRGRDVLLVYSLCLITLSLIIKKIINMFIYNSIDVTALILLFISAVGAGLVAWQTAKNLINRLINK